MATESIHMPRHVPLRDIFVVGERRPLDDEVVNALVQSIQSIGLQTPITIRGESEVTVPETGEVLEAYALVAGRHRLEAYRKLDRAYIPAIVLECDKIEAELIEIAENLHRADLTREERDRCIRRYAELLRDREAAEKKRIPGQNDPVLKRGPGQPKGVATKIAEQTGLSKSTVKRALNPKPPKPPREPAVDKHGDPDMYVVAHKLASKHTVGELQDLIDHLTDIIKARLGAAA